ncbi:MAG: hypothetical protein LC792_29485, partial [Actinobacteria bacterium]|nr:hypothetical protein [Actinomycetota bacterium]
MSFVAVLGLFASGAGNSAPGFAAPLASQFLSGLHLDRSGDVPAADAMATAEVAAGPVGTTTIATEPVASTTAEAPPPVASSSTISVDRPIIAPPAFPRTRVTAPRSTRTAYAPGPKDGGVWAVVVGIDDYPGTDADLRAAVADARDVDNALAAYGVPT